MEKIRNVLSSYIENFESNKLENSLKSQFSGTTYTPEDLVDLVVKNTFYFYFKNILQDYRFEIRRFNFKTLKKLILEKPALNNLLKGHLNDFKVLDPSCGSGRFLLSNAKFLFKLYKVLNIYSNDFERIKTIIEKHIYGIEKDRDACMVSRAKLCLWVLSELKQNYFSKLTQFNSYEYQTTQGNSLIEKIIEYMDFEFKIFNRDFLLEYDPSHKFHLIIGNPPYIENKKIKNKAYKKRLYNSFESAYKLFDMSILFIEKAFNILRKKSGYISYILTNKFLAADYGIKIRSYILNSKIIQIINISSIPIFKNRASYPIIITLKHEKPDSTHEIKVRKYNTSKEINSIDVFHDYDDTINQKAILSLPKKVIPIEGNLTLIQQVFQHCKSMKDRFKDLSILYRPYGFTNYARYFDSIIKKPKDKEKLGLLIGTGNIGKFLIKFNKRIRIAKRDLTVSYFQYPSDPLKRDLLNGEKLIIREIAKELTCVYDPGIFTNITGLYFIRIPSISTQDLFCLMNIINSNFQKQIWNTLYGALHMSGGYLRFNGSFLETMPIPDMMPKSLALLGKILQFLNQFRYDSIQNNKLTNIKVKYEINESISFFTTLSDALVKSLFFLTINSAYNDNFFELFSVLHSEKNIPFCEYKFTYPYFKHPDLEVFTESEIKSYMENINNYLITLRKNKQLEKEIEEILSIKYY
jgi:hypothetical protein